ncbi:MAG: hypothetical protein V1934_05670 [Methanobacteriota archaeon]
MRSNGKGVYGAGDQLHFIVTEDFVETANEFMRFCRANSINTSAAIRTAMSDWLEKKTMRDKWTSQMDTDNPFMRSFAEEYERRVLKEE